MEIKMKKLFIGILSLTICLMCIPMSTYANIDYPFSVKEGVSKLNDIFKELHDNGDITWFYKLPDEPEVVDDKNHDYLYIPIGNPRLIITFRENENTNHITEVRYSGGWEATTEFMTAVYSVGVLLADPTLSYEQAVNTMSQVLSKESGRYDSGNLEYVFEDGYKLTVAILTEPTEGSDNGSSIQENVTMGEAQALKKAQQYLAISAFSYEGLIEQLIYDKFSEDEAKYAADRCGADWLEQAITKAETYLKISSFSRDGLMDQLQYDGFSYTEAYYAVLSLGYKF